MSTEYGIFSDEGLLEGDFYSQEEAEAAIKKRYCGEDAFVGVICHDHPGHEASTCERCNTSDDESEDANA